MELIRWNECMSVGVPALDFEHQTLINTLNHLHARIEEGHADDVMRVIFGRLTDYAHTHFRHEEALFVRYGFAQAAAHRAEHVEFGNKVMDLQLGLLKGDRTVSRETLVFLRDWLSHHILNSDMAYKACLGGRDLK
jgi:hemerythrin-like metal-binding protein